MAVFQYGVLQVMVSIFLKLISFRREQFVLAFSKEAAHILSLLEASDNKLRSALW